MKRLFIIAVLFLSCASGYAQWGAPKKIDASFYEPYKSVFYLNQAGAWKKVVKESPENQEAWRNLFFATFLAERNSLTELNTDDIKKPKTALVLRKMKEAIPDSYVFNLCACHFWIESEWGEWDKGILRKTVELMPGNAYDDDVQRLARMVWEKECNNKELLAKIYYRVYDKHFYPYREMRYGWNLIQSMSKNAILIAHDAMEFQTVKIIQEVLEERRDITVIPFQYIFNREFTDTICKMLHIKPFVLKGKKDVSKENYVEKFTMHLIKETKRPLYQPFDMINYSSLCMDSLYNEGLLMKYRGLKIEAKSLYDIIQAYIEKNTDNAVKFLVIDILGEQQNEDTPDF